MAAGAVYINEYIKYSLNNYDISISLFSPHTKNKSKQTWDKHSKPRPVKQRGVSRNEGRGDKNKKYEHPINPNKRKK